MRKSRMYEALLRQINLPMYAVEEERKDRAVSLLVVFRVEELGNGYIP